VDLDLTERVVIVTGGSSGIGYEIARAFAQERARVVITARRPGPLSDAAGALTKQTGAVVIGIPADTTEQTQVDALVDAVQAKYSRVDILINCAASPSGLVRNQIEELDAAALLRDLNTKVVGYARCCKAVAPMMKQRRWGRIVNIGGLTGRSSNTLSGMRNAALCHMTKTLSDQLGPDGITVNTVHPGVIRTPHLQELFESEANKHGTSAAQIEAQFISETPVRRILSAGEIAAAVTFLASGQAASITGESIAIDGGITRGIYL
jgi:NAD(P)-dependent dehydrogenase (short-subunit alcohol dehydrogenase family)